MTGRWRRLEQRPDIGATFAADGADEIRLDVRQPHMVRPAVGTDLDVMATTVVSGN